jgi:DNA-binding CsgD family transcriptional regulator
VIIDVEDYLEHYGTPRHSGRYPWGSGGDDKGQRNRDFLNYVADLKSQGMSEIEVARGLGLSIKQLRDAKSIAKNAQKAQDIAQAERLRAKGMSNVAIGAQMGINESSVRALLAPGVKDRAAVLESTSNMLKEQVAKKGYIDIGTGVELYSRVGVSRTKFNTAVSLLEEQGYKKYYVKVEQLGTGKQTTVTVLAAPGTTYSELYRNRDNIKQIEDFSTDGGRTFLGIRKPVNVSSKRVQVKYADDGGAEADGVIYVRPGKKDLSLGSSRYAQVRIAIDGTHYAKGVAVYRDDLPDGIDLVVNTNKDRTGNKLDALKQLKNDPDNPFGAVISRQHGAMNIINEEGDWEKWSKTLSSQVLSKQSPKLAKDQLDIAYQGKRNELDGITKLNNPAVRKKLLDAYADDADSAAVHLKAAQLPRQASHVIIPINSLKDTEVYAPNYDDGERVVLIRYPHAGIFEIPELTVNNKHPAARKALGTNTRDAIGINSKVASRLSGADFDGDTVLVIPNNQGKIKTAKALEGLKDFDPVRAYPAYPGMKPISPRTKQVEMGVVSNLITDMTIRGANPTELARAVRHSMVVIDAEKHNLNYKQSAINNGITQLKQKYQKLPGDVKAGGASTLISRAGSEIRVADRKPRPASEGGPIDRATGKRVFVPTGEMVPDGKGGFKPKTFSSTKLAETDDAHTLSSGTPIEKIYADHSNRLKQLANDARRISANTKSIQTSSSAKAAYSKEVASLDSKLRIAQKNAPLERQAQILANTVYRTKLRENPDMDPSDKKKIRSQALTEARLRTGARKEQIEISDDEWAAIQAGAISNNKLINILNNANLDRVKQLATPKTEVLMTSAKTRHAQALLDAGYTQAEVARKLGVSVTTLKRGLSGE